MLPKIPVETNNVILPEKDLGRFQGYFSLELENSPEEYKAHVVSHSQCRLISRGCCICDTLAPRLQRTRWDDKNAFAKMGKTTFRESVNNRSTCHAQSNSLRVKGRSQREIHWVCRALRWSKSPLSSEAKGKAALVTCPPRNNHNPTTTRACFDLITNTNPLITKTHIHDPTQPAQLLPIR